MATFLTSGAGQRALCAVLAACAACACVDAGPPPLVQPPPPAPSGPPVELSYETTDGGALKASDLRGRFTVIALIATYDLASQAQLKVLGLVQRSHAPRVNVAAIALDPPENKPLVIAFSQSLRLPFPVGIADDETREGRGPFGGLRSVPSVIILDRSGREVLRHVGVMDEKPLHAELTRLDPRKAPP